MNLNERHCSYFNEKYHSLRGKKSVRERKQINCMKMLRHLACKSHTKDKRLLSALPHKIFVQSRTQIHHGLEHMDSLLNGICLWFSGSLDRLYSDWAIWIRMFEHRSIFIWLSYKNRLNWGNMNQILCFRIKLHCVGEII